ncbi:hypothetical protein GCM10025881_15570 [Pseudolysinimonas kribbensis]|uniref:Uncharacterized protein n=1 Tax=Pseudolysinimonas kribbensis TaxID=433641 RepID=A0ABQ6K2P7_9MICO|nr:hypothetical protein GCM10025881_15570 [Pseudolysinimonas kribbensis]
MPKSGVQIIGDPRGFRRLFDVTQPERSRDQIEVRPGRGHGTERDRAEEPCVEVHRASDVSDI